MSVAYTIVTPQAALPEYDLTVITVCRNALPELKRTAASVLEQKAKGTLRIEHLIVDGKSDDGTPTWLQNQLDSGKIEAFISEPDRGIYDAMNKGINMARGRVLAFLNAADTYTEHDLRPCITPILDGRTRHTIASARIINPRTGKVMAVRHYDSNALLLSTPGCHQAYFAAADAYRALGGYRAEYFRCCADGVFINTLATEDCEPINIPCVIANYVDGGFSVGCGITFVDEFIELEWMFHREAIKRAAKNTTYARMLGLNLLRHYRYLSIRYATACEIPHATVAHLQRMTDDILRLPIGEPAINLLQRLSKLLVSSRADKEAKQCLNDLANGRQSRVCERFLKQAHPSYAQAILLDLIAGLLPPRRLARAIFNLAK